MSAMGDVDQVETLPGKTMEIESLRVVKQKGLEKV